MSTDYYMLICGGRKFSDAAWMRAHLECAAGHASAAQVTLHIVHGDAAGADSLAGSIAQEMGLTVHAVPADWKRYPKQAGFKRNELMARTLVKKAKAGAHVAVVHFPGGSGTAHMRATALGMGLPVFRPVAQPARPGDADPLACPECGKVCKSQAGLTNHHRTHAEVAA